MTDVAFQAAADRIGCDLATMRAVFKVESAGRYLDDMNEPIRRFEPHHFPKAYWPKIGFAPQGAPWRASLALSKRQREDMFEWATAISYEDACKAASWGAPQIMGFNASLCGYASASSMVLAFRSPDKQIEAFSRFVINKGLAIALIQRDWLRFAVGYNGSGQAAVYARKIADAYEQESGRVVPPARDWDALDTWGTPERPVEPRIDPAVPIPPPKPSPATRGFWARLLARIARWWKYL